VRRASEELCAELEVEDLVVQSMADASPLKWHLGHCSWALEHFVLRPHGSSFRADDEAFDTIFNSYYDSIGPQFERPRRGVLSRPTVEEVMRYRAQVDRAIQELVGTLDGEDLARCAAALQLAMHHEQQHQELMLMDIKHAFARSPLRPAYRDDAASSLEPAGHDADEFVDVAGGLVEIGAGLDGFSYDNERARHIVFLSDFRLATSLVTNADFLAFMGDGGYRRPELWLADGWATAQARGWEAPEYWQRRDDGSWLHMTLGGMRPVVGDWPVVHLSYYEADAYARWAECRLPTELEWEHAATYLGGEREPGTLLEDGSLHPVGKGASGRLRHMIGEVWEWTSSAYLPYPGFAPLPGSLGEYNGKFMSGQMVLRGGSCVTPRAHIRSTYRNFFPPDKRWQFGGMRLARNE
jgi:ergothioneine biosynthesis protein EgtB